jgi:hypothetical protein
MDVIITHITVYAAPPTLLALACAGPQLYSAAQPALDAARTMARQRTQMRKCMALVRRRKVTPTRQVEDENGLCEIRVVEHASVRLFITRWFMDDSEHIRWQSTIAGHVLIDHIERGGPRERVLFSDQRSGGEVQRVVAHYRRSTRNTITTLICEGLVSSQLLADAYDAEHHVRQITDESANE